ncbi:MAG: DNA gyrase subunit A [Euryarchaeota archaeon]|nr:DNA gyrase subunit A [Euryarchaeota archaeon]
MNGQGNFGCFTSDTSVKLLDGTGRTFEELAEMYSPDETFCVYSVDDAGNVVVGEARHSHVTRKDSEVIELVLDSGDVIRCTPDHRFMLRDGTYKQAYDLTVEDSLMPGYFATAPVREGMSDYLTIQNPATGIYEFVHRLADRYNETRGAVSMTTGPFVRHHKDFNRWNNDPTNIERVEFTEHLRLHTGHIRDLWSDEDFRRHQREGVQRYYGENPAVIEERRQRFITQNQSEEFRSRIGQINSERSKQFYHDHPESCREISRRMKELWQDPDYRQKMSEALTGIEKRPLAPEEQARVAKIISEKSREMWQDKTKRAEIIQAIRHALESPEVRDKMSEQSRAKWQGLDYRAKFANDHFSRMSEAFWKQPGARELHRQKVRKQWEDADFRAKQREGVQASNVRRLEDNPEMMHQLAKQAAGSLRQKWKDDQYKKRVMRSKILHYGSHLLSQNESKEITPELYDRARYNNCIPRFEKAMGYFESFDEFLSLSATYNHRIVSKRMLDRRFDVYDITVEPYHNFLLGSGVFVHNSIDGDSAAAMRYTEVKMAKVAKELLEDINKDTVDFVPNYDNSLKEPSVLPALLPNLLVNGSTGIAVGMATNMPPHNLGEVVDGTIHMIDNPDATVHELMAHVKAPDFPTAAAITGLKGVLAAYTTGRGIVEMIARTEIETTKDRERIIVTELPYRVNKAKLVENIADLVKGKQVEGISDLRDESDKDGIRVVIETKKGANTQVILNQLYKHTQLKTTFGIINLVLVNGEPKVLPLKGLMQCYIDHRKDIIIRRSRYDLKKAKDRLHILDGLKIALDNIDAVIKLIRSSKTTEAARDGLIANFGLSDVQAKAILEMQLRRLTGIEREKLEAEYASLEETIAFLKEVLANPQKVLYLIKEELLVIKEKYADPRRTGILEAHEEFEDEDLIPSEDAILTISNTGYIKRVPVDTYRSQGRGGRGVIGMGTKAEDVVEAIFIANTHDHILFFTDKGKVHWLKVYKIPGASRQSKGKAIVNLLELSSDENVTAFVKVSEFNSNHYLVMATKRGIAKRTALSEFARPRKGGIVALKLDAGDELVSVRMVADSDDILIGTAHAKAIRFHAPDVRSMGRSARGVRGITLAANDYVVDMEIVEAGAALLTLTENGYGKRTEFDEYRVTRRGGKGIITIVPSLRNGIGIAIKTVYEDDELLVTSQNGNIIRIPVRDIRMQGRNTQGVRIMRLDPGDRAVAVARVGRLTDNDVDD